MKYFIVEDSLDEKVVGKDFPQAYKFIKGYNPDAPNMLFSIYKYRKSFPDYIPDKFIGLREILSYNLFVKRYNAIRISEINQYCK